MKYLLLSLIILQAVTLMVDRDQECRFAHKYSREDILNSPDDFLREFIRWEANFIKDIGVDEETGFTYDGIRVDVTTGLKIPSTLHTFTASSKQCIHLAVMARCLENATFADQIYTPTQVFRIIEKKVATLQKFYQSYPGFGGYLPWVTISDGKLSPAHDFQSRVPALDNGEMFWGALALSRVWEKHYRSILPQLRARFDQLFWKGMIRNSRKMFFNESTGKIRAVADIQDVHLSVENNRYSNKDAYYLDDPYEGELFTWIITLFGQEQFTQEEIEFIWTNKRKKLQSVEYEVPSRDAKITVEKGFWFSSHEQWKLLFLPYRLSSTYKRIQANNERARTWHSSVHQLPGMYGCQAGPAENNTQDTGYYCSGIAEIAFQPVLFDKLVTPYGSYPLLLLDKVKGAVWLHNQISSPAGQTKYGSLEGTGLNGSLISPVLTWDTKITAALATMNGTVDIISQLLEQKGVLSILVDRVEKEYSLAFKDIKGEQLEIAMPSRLVREGRPDFTTCQ